ncbi:hypothetical protein N7491_006711 [Penicillium cf. griseofulvum]|uniref:BZIP domain-containing protein n=1 Tax=Penicillium cf. griseofulvum TaxID=2972120 RepID=A0A9W9M2X1_9EURO|nr:hypothetical protein N7472_010262 [Penicillium cf. griseofulvum]KAJ5429695.1 hypothetical protein N7491_006711 [Penicillium cf. griseofulvum]KAJ5436538.1 hypothetical protein N7445_007423 [Penicillium cf. griseofulvum]
MTSQRNKSSALHQISSDNSTETLDPAARRRLQNRLNQRASRERKALQTKNQQKAPPRKWVIYIEDSSLPNRNASTKEATSHRVMKSSSPPRRNEEYSSHTNPTQQNTFLNNLYRKALHMIQHPAISRNPTFCATGCNIIGAMLVNASLMGLTFDLLHEDLASQFNLVGPRTFHLPPSLHPSQKQRKIIHHPWIDLIPVLSLREALLARTDEIDEDEICCDFYENESQEVGLRVWGHAWDPAAYEASETLLRKWSWMVHDCPEIVESSNYWRRRRGEEPIVFKPSDIPISV